MLTRFGILASRGGETDDKHPSLKTDGGRYRAKQERDAARIRQRFARRSGYRERTLQPKRELIPGRRISPVNLNRSPSFHVNNLADFVKAGPPMCAALRNGPAYPRNLVT